MKTREVQMKKIILDDNGNLQTVDWEGHFKVEEEYRCNTCGKRFWDVPDMNRTLCCECFFSDEFEEEED